MAVKLYHSGKDRMEVAEVLGVRAELVKRWRRKNGILQISIPKSEEAKVKTARKIEISKLLLTTKTIDPSIYPNRKTKVIKRQLKVRQYRQW